MMEHDQRHNSPDLVELPLFPLNLVLFPGMRLPLHIFEERYKTMIGECIDSNSPFGVLLIKEGPEAGGTAEPFRVGTTARITQNTQLDGGRLNILTIGEKRFQLIEIIKTTPFMLGNIQYLSEELGEVPESLIIEISEEYSTFLKQLATVAGGWNRTINVNSNPASLAREVIATMAASIEMPKILCQELLENSAVVSRLETLLPLLKQGNELMQEKVEDSNPFKGARLN
mgnify:CR=1 FL=1